MTTTSQQMKRTRGRPCKPKEQKGIQLNVRLPAKAIETIKQEADALGIHPATHAREIVLRALAAKHFGEWSY